MAVLTKNPSVPALIEDPAPYTKDEFAQLAAGYPGLRIEMSHQGEIIIMPPVFSETGRKNFKIISQLGAWVEQTQLGEGFESSTGFTLPNGAERSPDASWIEASRWAALSSEQREYEFAPICPDFVLELRSKTDRLSTLQGKMVEYISNGARLGWLIDPVNKRAEVYRPEQDVEIWDCPEILLGDPVLPGFILKLSSIW